MLVHCPWLPVADTKVIPAGSVFVNTILVAASGPEFVTVKRNATGWPISTEGWETVIASLRFAMGRMVDTTADALFVMLRSSWFPDTVNLLVNGPPMVGRTVRVIVAEVALERFPRLHVTVPDALPQLPWEVVAETKIAPGGSVFWTVAVEVAGPRLVTAMDKDLEILLHALGFAPASLDQLVARTGLSPGPAASMLLMLELQGDIEVAPGGRYRRLVNKGPG